MLCSLLMAEKKPLTCKVKRTTFLIRRSTSYSCKLKSTNSKKNTKQAKEMRSKYHHLKERKSEIPLLFNFLHLEEKLPPLQTIMPLCRIYKNSYPKHPSTPITVATYPITQTLTSLKAIKMLSVALAAVVVTISSMSHISLPLQPQIPQSILLPWMTTTNSPSNSRWLLNKTRTIKGIEPKFLNLPPTMLLNKSTK